MTATIKGYAFKLREVTVYPNIWDDKKQKVKPVKSMDGTAVHEVLDSIALAVEAGVVSAFNWPQQFFANKKAFMEFIDQLEGYGDCFRISDQWWQALAELGDKVDEEAFVSSSEIANALIEDAEEYGLLDWTKSKALRYTAEQFEAAYFRVIVAGSLPFDMRELVPQAVQNENHEITGYCGRFADYPKISEERVAEAKAEAEAMVAVAKAAKKATKKAPAKKVAAKKAK
jgi:hypothetical protein